MAKNKLYDIRVRVARMGISMNDVINGIRESGDGISQSTFSKALNREASELTARDYEVLAAADRVLKKLETKGV